MEESSPRRRITALLTCHNRRHQTVACIDALRSNTLPPNTRLGTIVVDAGSRDGTPDALRGAFGSDPDFVVVDESADLYWSSGMRRAHELAAPDPYDYLLYLNDDVLLDSDAVSRLIALSEACLSRGAPAIVVGSTRDPATGAITYGGRSRRGRIRRTRFELVEPTTREQPCETLNMNVALVPRQVASVCGGIDRAYVHAIGDLDYGLRARRAGFAVVVAPGTHGTCANDHSPNGTWMDRRLPMTQRLKLILSPKGVPPKAWFTFCRRHAGPAWVLYAAWPFVKALSSFLIRPPTQPKSLRQ